MSLISPHLDLPNPPQSRLTQARCQKPARGISSRFVQAATCLLILLPLAACKHFSLQHKEYVYVAARQVYLHDRVAAVSNRVGQVTNGQALELIERGKRFVKVKTPKGEIGWLEEHAVIDDKLYEQFQALTRAHTQDPTIDTAELRDDLYLHVLPGRETPHFLLIPGNAKVQLLERGTVEKTAPGSAPKPKQQPVTSGPRKPSISQALSPSPPMGTQTPSVPATPSVPEPPAVPMEDWWLVRDTQGHTGWLLAGRLDVDVPDEVGAYAEGQRMVGAYPIAKVTDYGYKSKAEKAALKSGKPTAKDSQPNPEETADKDPLTDAPATKQFTEYVTVLTPPRGGLPYDFDQVRVFVWSLNHHRYETAFRLHGIQGYLPIKIGQETDKSQTYPNFTFQIADNGNVTVDAATGVTRPVAPRTLSFRLEGNQVRRTGPDQAPIILTHESSESAKKKTGKKKH